MCARAHKHTCMHTITHLLTQKHPPTHKFIHTCAHTPGVFSVAGSSLAFVSFPRKALQMHALHPSLQGTNECSHVPHTWTPPPAANSQMWQLHNTYITVRVQALIGIPVAIFEHAKISRFTLNCETILYICGYLRSTSTSKFASSLAHQLVNTSSGEELNSFLTFSCSKKIQHRLY